MYVQFGPSSPTKKKQTNRDSRGKDQHFFTIPKPRGFFGMTQTTGQPSGTLPFHATRRPNKLQTDHMKSQELHGLTVGMPLISLQIVHQHL